MDSAAFDTNNDGDPDQWQYFINSTQLIKIKYDSDFNGKLDRWEHYNSLGNLSRMEVDNNNDGVPDIIKKKG